jgi:hypothetical protein
MRITTKRWRAKIVLMAVHAIVAAVLADCGHAVAETESTASTTTTETRVPLDLFKDWNFDKQAAGQAPAGFSEYAAGATETASWTVERDSNSLSPPNILRPSGACSDEECLKLLLIDALQYEYFDAVVRIRLEESAKESRGAAGLVFDVRDRQNFYAATVDVSGQHLNVIRVQGGKSTSLAHAEIAAKPQDWHLMRVRRNTTISKEYIEVFFDGQQAFSVEDRTFRTGQIGLMARGTSEVVFDNLSTAPLYSQKPLSSPAPY